MNYMFITTYLEDGMIKKDRERNSSTYFKDDLYFVIPEQIYMYNLKPHLDYCFVKPLKKPKCLREQKRTT